MTLSPRLYTSSGRLLPSLGAGLLDGRRSDFHRHPAPRIHGYAPVAAAACDGVRHRCRRSCAGVGAGGPLPERLMGGVSPERLQRFFVAQPGAYVVGKAVRDLCIFSAQNILRDPPFSRMDMISCRNLLIYLDSDAQRRVFPVFHYALRPGGFLFLGQSETIGRFTELFAALDKTKCVYRAVDGARPRSMPLSMSGSSPGLFPCPLRSNPFQEWFAASQSGRSPYRSVDAAACGRHRKWRDRLFFSADWEISRTALRGSNPSTAFDGAQGPPPRPAQRATPGFADRSTGGAREHQIRNRKSSH